MTWNEEQFRVQAEVILNLFDLTSLEVDRAVVEWHEEIGDIPEGWFDDPDLPGNFAESHTLGKLQDIIVKLIRERS